MTQEPSPDARFLVLTELFLPTKGGTAVWAAEVYKRLGGKGIHIVTADVPGAKEFDASHPNSVHRLDLRRVPWLRPESLGMYVRFFVKSLALALTHRFSAIHAFRALPEGLVAWLVARLTLRPVVIYAHGEELTTWGRGNKYRAMRFALRHAHRVVANSGYTRDTLVSMGVEPARIRLIHPGADLERFRPGLDTAGLREGLGIGPREKLVFAVGRLSRRKGFDRLVEAVARLGREGRDVRCVLGGIGEDAEYLDGIITRLDARARVHRIGAVAEEDLPRWMNACDLFAMPNREIEGDTEGFGMVFIEASACGKPVLGGRAGGVPSAVEDGVTGLLVDGDDVESVYRGLRRLLDRPDLARDLGASGLARARQRFSWERVAAVTLESL
ncbi:MAG TPA: glycosyltransferase family 4 protein [Thiobacillaceae bacterium]|nr:glycosyltransferase family 4 protein [Thiobacillaceae bacterium]HNU65190.1 glycosyltransferase family 4 protein [Thiobacillaceae bacterium]